MSTSNLPPLRNLPNWSRVGTLDKTRYPRLFRSNCASNAPRLDTTVKSRALPPGMDSDLRRITSLEKDVIFLQQQHRETLGKLHQEIDALKRENKESLHTASSGSGQDVSLCPDRPSGLHGSHGSDSISSAVAGPEGQEPVPVGGPLVSLHPLRVQSGPSDLPRPPSLLECERLIQHLCQANQLQAHELLQLRAVLKDIVLNKKRLSAEAISQTKAYLATDCPREGSETFPKIAQKPAAKRPSQAQASVGERLVLPSIRPSCISLTERQRRAQDTHKTRLRKAS